MEKRILKKGERCAYQGCRKMATAVVYLRKADKFVGSCGDHDTLLMDADDQFEYSCDCPNCGCVHQVN